jgi:hypothetical protein
MPEFGLVAGKHRDQDAGAGPAIVEGDAIIQLGIGLGRERAVFQQAIGAG